LVARRLYRCRHVFVISGYLITSIILYQKEKGSFNFISFYEKRIKRIAPAYYAAILLIAVAGCYFYLQSDTTRLRSGLYRAIVFLSNQFFASGESYFGAALSENPLLHTWSLAIEMQFYLILPFLLIFIRNKYLPYVIGASLLILTAYSTYGLYYTDNFSAIYFSLLSRIPEFFVGVLLSILFLNKNQLSRSTSTVISIIGIIALVGTALLINESTPFPGILALLPCVATGLLLVSGQNIISRILSSRPMVYIGELSYSLYLWHWPIMAYLRYNDSSHSAFTITEIFIVSTLTFACAWLSYTYVEKTFRQQSNRQFALSFAPVALLLCIITIKLPAINFNGYIAEDFTKTVFGEASHSKDSVETFGNLSAKNNRIALIGDSHAHVLKSFMDYMGKRHDFSFKTLTTSGLPAIEGIHEEDFTNANISAFRKSLTFVNTTKGLINNSEIIFINSIGFHRVPSLRTALENLAKNLRTNQKLVIFITVPTYSTNPLRLNKDIRKDSTKTFEQRLFNIENERIIQEVAKKHKNVYVYDLSKSEVFNDSPFYQDTLMYYDHSHLNLYGSLALARNEEERFEHFLQQVLVGNSSRENDLWTKRIMTK